MKLEEHLKLLPKHSVEIDLWNKIDQQLSASSSLEDKLPIHKANSDLWNEIESALEKRTPRRFLRFRHLSIAASAAVVITLGTVFFTHNTNEEHIYFSEEIVITNQPIDNNTAYDVDVMDNCNEQPAVCSSPDFTRLKSNLDQLKREEVKLRDLKKATNDPQLDLYHSRIVKNIQQVEAQMMQMFS